MTDLKNITTDEERAFYGMKDVRAENIKTAGPADGESAFKECTGVTVSDSEFNLRYPFWHDRGLSLSGCSFTESCRAALWYSEEVSIKNCRFDGVKVLRECGKVRASDCSFNTSEFGWRCRGPEFSGCSFVSDYFLFESSGLCMKDSQLRGKYSFQYVEGGELENCLLDTKDAFWHSKNVTLRDCEVKGEYLAWYSENLTLINCRISGTQPFCYCRGLKLVNCTMTDTDLAFEYSEVDADIKGTVLSVKNPSSGRILADGYGEIILKDSVKPTECEIATRT